MKKILILVGIFFLSFLTGCSNHDLGDISHVSFDGTYGSHEVDDMNEVVSLLKTDFHTKDFQDCTLDSIKYALDYSALEESLKNDYQASDAIVLEFSFTTGRKPAIVFESFDEYHYTAWFVKKETGWEKVNWGQG